MRPWMFMLLTVSLAVMPLRLQTGADCCCQDQQPISADAHSDALAGCCGADEPASDDAPDKPSKPAECPGGCDCPARCCIATPTFACCALAPRTVPNFQPVTPSPPPTRLSRGEDHPDRLKRPPRA